MSSSRNGRLGFSPDYVILIHWEMSSSRNCAGTIQNGGLILIHWEMSSSRNVDLRIAVDPRNFNPLGNEL